MGSSDVASTLSLEEEEEEEGLFKPDAVNEEDPEREEEEGRFRPRPVRPDRQLKQQRLSETRLGWPSHRGDAPDPTNQA